MSKRPIRAKNPPSENALVSYHRSFLAYFEGIKSVDGLVALLSGSGTDWKTTLLPDGGVNLTNRNLPRVAAEIRFLNAFVAPVGTFRPKEGETLMLYTTDTHSYVQAATWLAALGVGPSPFFAVPDLQSLFTSMRKGAGVPELDLTMVSGSSGVADIKAVVVYGATRRITMDDKKVSVTNLERSVVWAKLKKAGLIVTPRHIRVRMIDSVGVRRLCQLDGYGNVTLPRRFGSPADLDYVADVYKILWRRGIFFRSPHNPATRVDIE